MEKQNAILEQEEARWIGKQIYSGSVKKVIKSFSDYVENIPINIQGWEPRAVNYNLKFITNKSFSSKDSPAKLNLKRNLSIEWFNVGKSTLVKLQDNLPEEDILFTMTGLNAKSKETIDVKSKNDFDVVDFKDYLEQNKGRYIYLLSILQEFKYSHPNFNFSIQVKEQQDRLVPYKEISTRQIIRENNIFYTKVIVNISIDGYGKGFKTLKEFGDKFNEIGPFITTKIKFEPLLEKIHINGYYIHPNVKVNER